MEVPYTPIQSGSPEWEKSFYGDEHPLNFFMTPKAFRNHMNVNYMCWDPPRQLLERDSLAASLAYWAFGRVEAFDWVFTEEEKHMDESDKIKSVSERMKATICVLGDKLEDSVFYKIQEHTDTIQCKNAANRNVWILFRHDNGRFCVYIPNKDKVIDEERKKKVGESLERFELIGKLYDRWPV